MILSRLDKQILAGCAATCALGLAVWSVPRFLVERAREQATACLDNTSAPVDKVRCDAVEADLARLARVPWVKHDATYRYEELRARRALTYYDDVTVLAPRAASLQAAADWVAREEGVIERGSERLTLDELGDTVGAPDVAAAAAFRGDRAALRARYDHIGLWTSRLAALEAALLDGEMQLADKMAARYAEFDPRDADLRSAVGAVLCLGPDPGRGLETLARIPTDRAEKRYAAIARPYGEVRAVQEACADLAAIEPPAMPIDRHAGLPDAVEARAVQALRLAQGEIETKEAQSEIRTLLASDAAPSGAGLDTRIALGRASLLAELVVSDRKMKAVEAAALATPRSAEEPPLAPEGPLDVVDLMQDPKGPTPYVPPATFGHAAERLRHMSTEEGVSADVAGVLSAAAHAFEVLAAQGHARAGERDAAVAASKRAAAADARPARAAALHAGILVATGAFAEARGVVRDARRSHLVLPREPVAADAPHGRAVREAAREVWALGFADAIAAAALQQPVDSHHLFDASRALGDPTLEARSRIVDLATVDLAKTDDLLPLHATMRGSDADKRKARRAFFAHRGTAPTAIAAHAIFLGRLMPEGAAEADVETWLDAGLAIDARRFSMREIAFARAIAARARGHEASAKAWEAKLAALRAPFADPRRAVIARFLGM